MRVFALKKGKMYWSWATDSGRTSRVDKIEFYKTREEAEYVRDPEEAVIEFEIKEVKQSKVKK